ncbi:hypothetical protein H5410_005269 [Solanum commersonii]|uniref:Retrovirus-related Pol polyprotein from transposon TNT 1-94-like beta-barrel domain-containing protein n=1 Tax=Solanum commersonii TaxID=4109 RepID=A0A9J6A6Z0_SOLCO|nr:hypothetical protein H5410_005269 [Solanum commersonii]
MQGQRRSGVELYNHHSQLGPSTSGGVGPAPHFTTNQYNQLLQILNKSNMNEANANMAGTFAGTSFCNIAAHCSLDWIVDSGASNHMVGDHTLLKPGSTVTNPGRVQLATGESTLITNSGTSQLKGDVLQDTGPIHSASIDDDLVLESEPSYMEDSQAEPSINVHTHNTANSIVFPPVAVIDPT